MARPAGWVSLIACALLLIAACGDSDQPSSADAAGLPDSDAQADDDVLDGETDGTVGTTPDAVDVDPGQDPFDAEAAAERFEQVVAVLGLDADDPADLRLVWDDAEQFEAYIDAWEVAAGVTFERAPSNKAECLHLASFDPSVPYCGPGCGNSRTVAPPCLNRGCFEHDACYAALECRSGQEIDVGLSFSALTECCDAPLAPTRDACRAELLGAYLAGDLSIAEAELFSAVASIMVAVEASELFDSPTDRPPGTCDETYDEACGPGALAMTAAPSSAGPDGEVSVCATLTRGGRPVGVWTAIAQDPPGGRWTTMSATASGEEAACLTWRAPADIDGTEGPIELEVVAEVLGADIATGTTLIELVPGEDDACGEGFVRIEPGSFTMGSASFVQDSTCSIEEQRLATVGQAFCMQVTELTQERWSDVMGTNPSVNAVCGAECPVENITWHDAILFANELSLELGFDPCYAVGGCTVGPGAECDAVSPASLACEGFRLPTEVEWEYAARAGTTGPTYGPIDEVAWYDGNAGGASRPVATREPNAWGLYDMLGNVLEFTEGTVTNPLGPEFPFEGCVVRSTAWSQPVTYVEAGQRSCTPCNGGRNGSLGVRFVRSLL